MRSKFKWIFTLLLAVSMQFSFAQEKTVTGVVSDKTGPIPGANVVVKGTKRATQTDFDGKFSIKAKQGETLLISFVGMSDASLVVGSASNVNVKMQDGVSLDEVVIDGYKSISKKRSGVSQVTISSKEIQGRPNVSFLQSLQSQAAGLNISTSSGTPGSAKIDVLIRGLSSVNGNTDPLYVIDGVPANLSVFRGINTEDIESATVLKDAGATAIYGNRGANGVIVIKTKKGSFNTKMRFQYSSILGFTTLQQNKYNLPNSAQLLTLERDAGAGLGSLNPDTGLPFTDAEIKSFPINTNWKDYFFRTGISKSHNLSFSSGSERMSNFTSLGYFEQQGIVPGTDFKRFSFRSNFTGKSENEKFTYVTNISLVFSKRNELQQETRTDINSNVLQNPLQGLLSSAPYLNPNDYVNGQQLFDQFGAPSFAITPFMLLDYLKPGNIPSVFDETKILANFSGTYKLTKDLSFTSTNGIDFTQNNRDFARAPQSYLAIIATPAGATFGGIETQSTDRDFGFTALNRLNYVKTFKEKHTIDVNVFVEYNKFHRKFFSYTQTGLDPRTWALGAGTGYIPFNPSTPTLYRPAVASLKRDAGLFSYFGTLDYDYDSRFGIDGTIRRDASYRFIGDNTWGTFWSISGRWNIDKEKFMSNSIFDDLKLRISYGTTGNQNILGSQVPGQNVNYLANNNTRDLNSSQVGYGNSPSIGIQNIANVKLKWETTTQANIGVDFSLYKHRLSGSIDIYSKETKDLFDSKYISAITTQYSFNANTNGVLKNKGIELSLKYDVLKNSNLKLNLFFNGSYNQNTINNLTYAPGETSVQTSANNAQVNGGVYDQYNLVPYIGVNPANGNLLFLDKDNNVTEAPTTSDRRLTGKSYIPKYQGGFGFSASYKGFFITSNFSFVASLYRFDFDLNNLYDPQSIGILPVSADLLNAWTVVNTNSNIPSNSAPAANIDAGSNLSDRFLFDASYVRLKTLSYGYDFSNKSLEKSFIKGLRIYGQLENYLTWSKWRGFDPESGLSSSNQGGYPAPKVMSFGIDLKF